MITKELLNPKSIAVIGASNDVSKPGGKILKNILDGKFRGELYVVNPKEAQIQGVSCTSKVEDLPQTDLAVLAIAAKYCPQTVEVLTKQKGTKGIIILSAGFSEESHEGKILEDQIVKMCNDAGCSLIGPNCVGMMNHNHHSIFTLPIPRLDPKGCDLISGSGATIVFILESGIANGLTFANVFSVGNSAQLGVEEILENLDESYDPATSAPVKLLYIETINKPEKLLKAAQSLIKKGCRIAAVKSGSSDAGSRAASSHTGALANSDVAVDALFKKAGIVRCYGRQDLVSVASIFQNKELKGKNIAIITHAGGPAVMLTDALSKANLQVPHIEGEKADELLTKLFAGSSVANPIDFLATGTAEQLGIIIDYCENHFDVDGMAVIFGTPGLFKLFDVYKVLDEKMKSCKKPIYPILPSTTTAKEEVEEFLSKGNVNFPDEVVFGSALGRAFYTPKPSESKDDLSNVDTKTIRKIIDESSDGYIEPAKIQALLDACGIPRAGEAVVTTKEDAVKEAKKLGYPIVMKVVGPVHKSDVGGVVLNVKDDETVSKEFERMIQIKDTTAILMQPMLSGIELFAGVNFEPKFGHLILCGLGGIFIEVLKDVQSGLAPLTTADGKAMIEKLNGYKILEGVRGQAGIPIDQFAEVVAGLSRLVAVAPEIKEMDLNPLLASLQKVVAVDARIRIEK
ncbi:MAG: acetate--CoA ligase family protein [Bacteroidales bacterium]|jgi:acetyltransferase|nr:acetate--CoA ligase family protein [Bacteroidales bacterium]